MQEIFNTLVTANNEGTNAPYWLIIDTNGKSEINGFKEVVGMIYGPFFSREDATAYLKMSSDFSEHAIVYCKSGYHSQKYLRVWRKIEAKKDAPQDSGTVQNSQTTAQACQPEEPASTH
jgi:hypothetical protein